MQIRRPIPALLVAAFLGGCLAEQEPLAPAAAAPNLALSAADAASGQHLVAFRGKGVPASFRAEVAGLGGSVLYTHDGAGLALITGIDAGGVRQLRAVKGVADVQADAALALETRKSPRIAAASVGATGHLNPGSALLTGWQWNMFAINADAAWDAGRHGSADVTVAIVDTGVDYHSPELAGLVDLTRSASFVPGDTLWDDAFGEPRGSIADYNGHGSNVASQVSSNSIFFAGLTNHTTLIGVKVLGATGSGTLGGVLFGLLWAADQDADVINMSLGSYRLKAGGGGQLQAVINSVLNYVNSAGSLVVVAAGNESVDLDHGLFPDPATGEVFHFASLEADYCTASHVICVSSVGPTEFGGSLDVPSVFTNFGRSAVDVAGPGGNFGTEVSEWPWGPGQLSWVWSLCPHTSLAFDDEGNLLGRSCPAELGLFLSAAVGTSQAAPHVSGLAALLFAERPGAKPSQIKSAIRNSAVDLGQAGNDPFFGQGRIDVQKALGL